MSQNILVVNAEGSEVRVAVIEQGSLAELFVERKRERGLVGNIYRGKVTRVLPGHAGGLRRSRPQGRARRLPLRR
jgi:ribonuclease G